MVESNGIFELEKNDFVIIKGKNSNECAIVMLDKLAFNGLRIIRVDQQTLDKWLETKSKDLKINIIVKIASIEDEVNLFAPKAYAGACFSESLKDKKYQLDIKVSHFKYKEKEDDLSKDGKTQESLSHEIEIELDR